MQSSILENSTGSVVANDFFFSLSVQKNPQAIRLAEEQRGLEQLTMSVAVNLTRAWQLSSHIHNMCSEAREAIYTREADVKHWLDKGQWKSYRPTVYIFI